MDRPWKKCSPQQVYPLLGEMNLGAHEPHVQKPTGQDDDCGVDEEMAHARVEVDQPVEDADKDAREKDLWPKWGGGSWDNMESRSNLRRKEQWVDYVRWMFPVAITV